MRQISLGRRDGGDPDANLAVVAPRRRHERIGGVPAHRVDRVEVTGDLAQLCAGLAVEDVQGCVLAAGHYESLIPPAEAAAGYETAAPPGRAAQAEGHRRRQRDGIFDGPRLAKIGTLPHGYRRAFLLLHLFDESVDVPQVNLRVGQVHQQPGRIGREAQRHEIISLLDLELPTVPQPAQGDVLLHAYAHRVFAVVGDRYVVHPGAVPTPRALPVERPRQRGFVQPAGDQSAPVGPPRRRGDVMHVAARARGVQIARFGVPHVRGVARGGHDVRIVRRPQQKRHRFPSARTRRIGIIAWTVSIGNIRFLPVAVLELVDAQCVAHAHLVR